MATVTTLEVRRRPRARLLGWGAAALALLVVTTWFVNSPADLPTSEVDVMASSPVGTPIYLGVFAPDSTFDRELQLSGVKVHTTANTQVDVTPLLCRGGTIGVTTEPLRFCPELLDPEGQVFREGDAVVLRVESELAAIAVIDRVRLGFREGLQWGTLEAGSSAIVRILGR